MKIIPICPICASNSIKEEFTIPDNEYGLKYKATYIHCNSCDCFYQSPMPSDDQLSSFYPDAYHSMQSKSIIARIKNTMRLKAINKNLNSGDTFMDFGCGNGSFILFASEKCPDRNFLGYEIDSLNSTISYNEGRVVIIKGAFGYLMKNMPMSNIISMHHVIEHLGNPKEIIEQLYQKLVAGGLIIGQTPATDSFERKLFKTRWSGFHAPRHTVIFSRKALRKTFTDIGFKGIEIQTGFNPAAYAVSLASLINEKNGGTIKRSGIKWIMFVIFALFLSPIDMMIKGSIMNFYARKR